MTTELATVEILPPAEYDNLRLEVMEAKSQSEKAYWRLATALFNVWNESAFEEWGYNSFGDYIDNELSMQRRKAQYLVAIAGWFGDQDEATQRWVKELGWTKARELIGVVDETNSAEWREIAESSSLRELTSAVKESRASTSSGTGGVDDSIEKPQRKMFSLFTPQYVNVEQALATAMTAANSDKEGHALDLICTEYLSQNGGIGTLGGYLKRIENIIGLKLVAFDPSQNEVAFGSETLDELFPDEEQS